MQQFLASIPWDKVAPIVVDFVAVVIMPLIYLAVQRWLKAKTTGEKQTALLKLAEIVYVSVEALASKGALGNKLQVALGKVTEAIGRPLTDAEKKTLSEAFAAKAFEAKSPSLQLIPGGSVTIAGKPFGPQS